MFSPLQKSVIELQFPFSCWQSMENGLNYMAVAFAMQLVKILLVDERSVAHVTEADLFHTIETLMRINAHSRGNAPEGWDWNIVWYITTCAHLRFECFIDSVSNHIALNFLESCSPVLMLLLQCNCADFCAKIEAAASSWHTECLNRKILLCTVLQNAMVLWQTCLNSCLISNLGKIFTCSDA